VLMIEAHRQTHVTGPALSPTTIKAILQYTATPLGAADALTQGAGAINVSDALTMARGIDTSRPLDADWAAGLLVGPNVVWNHAIDWAANIVWGPELVGSVSGTDGQTYVWGYADTPATTTWGNLQSVPDGGQTFVWGYAEETAPRRR
jgi:hypothetical protein